MPVKKVIITEGGKSQEVIIAMTEEEAKDKSFVEYVELANREETKEKLRKTPVREAGKHSQDEVKEGLRELRDFRYRKQAGTKKYW